MNLEFHRSEDPFSCAISRNRKFVHAKYAPPLPRKSAGISSRMRAHHRLETWLEKLGRFGTRPILFIYFFPLLLLLLFLLLIRKNRVLSSFSNSGPELLKLRNYDGNHSSIRECCTNMSVAPSLEFPL